MKAKTPVEPEISLTPSWTELRPRLADGVSVDAPLTDGAPWVIAAGGVPRARVGADFAQLAALFDGERTVKEAVEEANVTADSAQAIGVVEALAKAGLLQVEAAAAGRGRRRRRDDSRSRLTFRPPLTVQWVLFDPASFARRVARPFRYRAFRVTTAAAVAVLLVLATASLAVEGNVIVSALSTPVSLELFAWLIGAVILTGCVHELSHAVTLAALGGRPTRMGIMLFYFMPAFFCDVTDGWRMGARWRRAAVALAGPGLHLLLASVAFAALLLPASAEFRTFLALYGVACLVAVVANLLPFIKLDGYLALVAITDRPYLRASAMAATSRSLARRLYGADIEPEAPREPAAMAIFGAACILFPIAMFAWAAIRLQPAFVGMGSWMAAIYLLLVVAFVAVTARRLVRFVAAALRHGAHVGRTILASVGVLAVASAALLVPVPATAHLGFVASDGRVLLVSSTASALESLPQGDPVRLLSNGIVLRPEIGTAELAPGPAEPARVDAPVTALAPVSMPDATAEAWGTPLAQVESTGALPAGGAAEVGFERSLALGAYLFDLLLREPSRAMLESGDAR
ncbi:daptide biosynthesis intramembrane metalloprotease [Microbacterium sp. 179-I 3D3 NHS]|uniref:daptide biosynthesis intramembrane metalloprotease n=1 Tax=Microbacterium sp. 179-I 3D3 NHS TaxID=3142382 RepID=UPI0039A12A69